MIVKWSLINEAKSRTWSLDLSTGSWSNVLVWILIWIELDLTPSRKWCYLWLMCLVLGWILGALAKWMALVFSSNNLQSTVGGCIVLMIKMPKDFILPTKLSMTIGIQRDLAGQTNIFWLGTRQNNFSLELSWSPSNDWKFTVLADNESSLRFAAGGSLKSSSFTKLPVNYYS